MNATATVHYDHSRDLVSEYPTITDHTSFVYQEGLPVPAGWERQAAFLYLPDTATVFFYCDASDGVPTSVHRIVVDLDPAINHGYVKACIYTGGKASALYQGEKTYRSLTVCPRCESPFAVYKQQAYGDSIDCAEPDCGFHSYYSIGD